MYVLSAFIPDGQIAEARLNMRPDRLYSGDAHIPEAGLNLCTVFTLEAHK
jgi:hypothetical protein